MDPGVETRLLSRSGVSQAEFNNIFANPSSYYRRYHIRQGSKLRQIEEPSEALMRLQRAFLPELEPFELHPACMAKPGMGIGDNALIHKDAKHLLRVDLKGCYQSITQAQCGHSLSTNKDYARWLPLSDYLHLCFINANYRQFLPTGAPTSPILCNIALTPLDLDIEYIAKSHNYQYSRYLDDIILSTQEDKREWGLLKRISNKIIQYGFQPNRKKTRWYGGANDPMRVTGVSIINKPSAPREIKRLVRARVYSLAKRGEPLDNITKGYLAHIHDIDPAYYLYMMDYYKRKRASSECPQRLSASVE